MSTQTQMVRVPKELYQSAVETADQYGVTIGEALRMMTAQANDTEKQSVSTVETAKRKPVEAELVDPETEPSANLAVASSPVRPEPGEAVIEHRHYIVDERTPERLEHLEGQAEEQREINALFGAGIMANNAMMRDHLTQHENSRKLYPAQSVEAGQRAFNDALEQMKNKRGAANICRNLEQLDQGRVHDLAEIVKK